ncbi:hypothetical protein Tco_0387002 [Tanacetum coccineum]
MRYVDTKSNKNKLRHCIEEGPYILNEIFHEEVQATKEQLGQPCRVKQETYANTTPESKKLIDVEAEAIHIILNGFGYDIYSTVDACSIAREMWLAIERLQQGDSINKQDVKSKLFWEFGKFTSRYGESIKSYYSRFYNMMNEMARNKLKQQQDLDTVSYHRLFDIMKQHQNEVNEIRAEKIARNANPLSLLVASQHYPNNYSLDTHYQTAKNLKPYAPSLRQTSSTRYHSPTRNKGKEIAKPITPPSKSAFEEEVDNEQELEAHYMYMAKIQEVPTINSRLTYDDEPLKKVQIDDDYNFNVTPDSSDMCDNEGHADQNVEKPEDERVMLASLIANFKLDLDENKKSQRQLKKPNTSIT